MKRRNEYAQKLTALRERMMQPGYKVMIVDVELLAEVAIDLRTGPRKAKG